MEEWTGEDSTYHSQGLRGAPPVADRKQRMTQSQAIREALRSVHASCDSDFWSLCMADIHHNDRRALMGHQGEGHGHHGGPHRGQGGPHRGHHGLPHGMMYGHGMMDYEDSLTGEGEMMPCDQVMSSSAAQGEGELQYDGEPSEEEEAWSSEELPKDWNDSSDEDVIEDPLVKDKQPGVFKTWAQAATGELMDLLRIKKDGGRQLAGEKPGVFPHADPVPAPHHGSRHLDGHPPPAGDGGEGGRPTIFPPPPDHPPFGDGEDADDEDAPTPPPERRPPPPHGHSRQLGGKPVVPHVDPVPRPQHANRKSQEDDVHRIMMGHWDPHRGQGGPHVGHHGDHLGHGHDGMMMSEDEMMGDEDMMMGEEEPPFDHDGLGHHHSGDQSASSSDSGDLGEEGEADHHHHHLGDHDGLGHHESGDKSASSSDSKDLGEEGEVHRNSSVDLEAEGESADTEASDIGSADDEEVAVAEKDAATIEESGSTLADWGPASVLMDVLRINNGGRRVKGDVQEEDPEEQPMLPGEGDPVPPPFGFRKKGGFVGGKPGVAPRPDPLTAPHHGGRPVRGMQPGAEPIPAPHRGGKRIKEDPTAGSALIGHDLKYRKFQKMDRIPMPGAPKKVKDPQQETEDSEDGGSRRALHSLEHGSGHHHRVQGNNWENEDVDEWHFQERAERNRVPELARAVPPPHHNPTARTGSGYYAYAPLGFGSEKLDTCMFEHLAVGDLVNECSTSIESLQGLYLTSLSKAIAQEVAAEMDSGCPIPGIFLGLTLVALVLRGLFLKKRFLKMRTTFEVVQDNPQLKVSVQQAIQAAPEAYQGPDCKTRCCAGLVSVLLSWMIAVAMLTFFLMNGGSQALQSEEDAFWASFIIAFFAVMMVVVPIKMMMVARRRRARAAVRAANAGDGSAPALIVSQNGYALLPTQPLEDRASQVYTGVPVDAPPLPTVN